MEARYFDAGVQATKRAVLLTGLCEEIAPAYAAQAKAQADARLTKLRAIAAR